MLDNIDEVSVNRADTSEFRADIACYGRADTVESAVVTGWFAAPGRGQINAFIDGDPAGQATVSPLINLPLGAPDETRGFSYAIPWHFQDGRSHVLSLVLWDGTAIEFPTRSGVTKANLRFRFAESDTVKGTTAAAGRADGGRARGRAVPAFDAVTTEYAGSADPLDGIRITGFAVRQGDPNERVRLRMFVDGQPAGDVLCDQPRDTLRMLGMPEQIGGFSFEIPETYLDGTTHSLSLLFDDGGALPFKDIDGNLKPKLEFTAEPVTSIEGVVDGLHNDKIRGWVVRKHHRTGDYEGRLSVKVICNGVSIGEICADLPRIDVAREQGCDPEVGFEFKLPPHCRTGQEFEFVFRALPEGEELAGCPVAARFRSTENIDEINRLTETVGELCAKAFMLQRQVRNMLPIADATVHNYDAWARRYLTRLREKMAALPSLPEMPPLVSIVMPTYKTNLAHLTAAIETVLGQTYRNWELIIVDDGSREPALTRCLKKYASLDERITYRSSRTNRGISKATNTAMRKARGDYVMLFDHDDLLVEVAVDAMVRHALLTGAKVVYSDEDKIDSFGLLSEPNLKPDWNYRLLLGINYICHPLLIDRALLRRAGSLRTEYDGAQDHDLLLRLSETCKPGEIVHLPEILYHWRKSATSTAALGEAKLYAIEAGRRAIADHLTRRGFNTCEVSQVGRGTTYRVTWGLSEQPSVTIIIPFKDQIATTRRCLDLLLKKTDWSNWRVVLVDNGSVTPEAAEFVLEAARDPHVVVRQVTEPFNYSRLNNISARENPADYYVFLNNDVFIEQPDWLRVLTNEALADPQVGIVGAKLTYPDGTVQHAGVVLGVGGVADHVFRGIPADHPGYLDRARCAQQYSAVTAACMLCRADVFMDVGGFDEQDLTVAFNDVDLCLKMGKQGWRIVWTPDVVAEHHESLSRGDDLVPMKAQRFFYENHVILERWHNIIAADPYYSPHFSRNQGIFSDLR